MVDFSIPISDNQYLKGSTKSPSGKPERTPSPAIKSTLGCK